MTSLFITILLAALLMALVVTGLAIGRLITGRSRLGRGCGFTPSQKKGEKRNCTLCGKEERCDSDDSSHSKTP